MRSARVLITCRQMLAHLERFRPAFDERGIRIEVLDVLQQPTEADLAEVIGGFDGMIAGDDPLTAPVLQRARRLKIISKWGIGTDGIDREAAAAMGIQVTNTPDVFGDEVADVALGYMVMLARQLHRIDASVKNGGWLKVEGRSLSGKTVGIAGFGNIGRAVARRALGFGMRVITHDVAEAASQAASELGVEHLSLAELFRRSDTLVLCCPLTPETHHMVNEETLSMLPVGANLVNVARGPLVSEAALAGALMRGQLNAAALDVFECEPLPHDSPLRQFEQCVFGSHNGSNATEGVLRASERAVENLFSGLLEP